QVTGEKRNEAVQKFQKEKEYKILISTDAGGEGLNLDSANFIFHYSLPWSYGKFVQRNGRIKRLTQKKPMMVYTLTARKSMDVYMAKTIRQKAKLSDNIFDVSSMSLEDIKNILTYDQE
ncbi:MAG: C-terminal helicase domain-containing protein, partial [Patescibacteria group bacterium]